MTGYRILRSETGPRVEVSFQAAGQILRVDQFHDGDLHVDDRADGTVFGDEGHGGVVRGAKGQMASWMGQGIGKPGRGQAISYRGAITTRARHRSGSGSTTWRRSLGSFTAFPATSPRANPNAPPVKVK